MMEILSLPKPSSSFRVYMLPSAFPLFFFHFLNCFLVPTCVFLIALCNCSRLLLIPIKLIYWLLVIKDLHVHVFLIALCNCSRLLLSPIKLIYWLLVIKDLHVQEELLCLFYLVLDFEALFVGGENNK